MIRLAFFLIILLCCWAVSACGRVQVEGLQITALKTVEIRDWDGVWESADGKELSVLVIGQGGAAGVPLAVMVDNIRTDRESGSSRERITPTTWRVAPLAVADGRILAAVIRETSPAETKLDLVVVELGSDAQGKPSLTLYLWDRARVEEKRGSLVEASGMSAKFAKGGIILSFIGDSDDLGRQRSVESFLRASAADLKKIRTYTLTRGFMGEP